MHLNPESISSIFDLMPIHQFHLSREREAEYRLVLPRSEAMASGACLATFR